MVSVDLHDLRRISTIVVVSSGPAKRAAVLGALRGGLVNVLIIDEALARELQQGDVNSGPGGSDVGRDRLRGS